MIQESNRLLRLVILGSAVPSQNDWDRFHWGKRSKMKRDWFFVIVAAMNARATNPAGHCEREEGYEKAVKGEKRRIVVTHYRKRLCDEDNLTAASKSLIIDNVRDPRIGLIFNDDPKHAKIEIRQHPVTIDLPMISIEIFKTR